MKLSCMVILFIQTSLYIPINCNYDKEWIDPFKLESEDLSQEIVPSNEDMLREVKETIDPFKLEARCLSNENEPSNDVMAYYKRTINLLVSSVVIEHSDHSNYKGRLFIDIPSEDYLYLRKFADARTEERLSLQKVDQIVTQILKRSRVDELSDIFLSWTDYLYFYTFNRTTGVCLTILMILIVVYKLLKANFTLYQILIYLVVLIFLGDFIFTWKRMLQELEINKYADSLQYDKMPADCKLSGMSAWQFFWSFISTTNCRTYHKVILYDVFWDVGPLDVIAKQSRVISEIASNIGIAISKLTSGLMSDLPFPLNILLLPFLLIFVLFLVWSVLTYLTETHIDLNLFHLVHVKFKTNKSIKDRPVESYKRHRSEVEEVEPPEIEKRKSSKKRKEKRNNKEENKADYENSVENSLIMEKEVVENISLS